MIDWMKRKCPFVKRCTMDASVQDAIRSVTKRKDAEIKSINRKHERQVEVEREKLNEILAHNSKIEIVRENRFDRWAVQVEFNPDMFGAGRGFLDEYSKGLFIDYLTHQLRRHIETHKFVVRD
jgi:hypothetical protein